MTSWQQFESEAPALAAKVRAKFLAEKSHVLATLRRDGSPRVSGSEVDFKGPDLLIGSMLNAVKARDLQRDGRFAIHASPSIEDGGDAKVSGVAREVTDPAEVKALQGNDEPAHVFRLDLSEVALTWVDADTLYIDTWQAGKPLVRFARPGNGPATRTEL
jgi:hypothetical protein